MECFRSHLHKVPTVPKIAFRELSWYPLGLRITLVTVHAVGYGRGGKQEVSDGCDATQAHHWKRYSFRHEYRRKFRLNRLEIRIGFASSLSLGITGLDWYTEESIERHWHNFSCWTARNCTLSASM